ncbi:M15 family metallopeptidase [Haloplasma contractile]|uniref:Carboxypeptidase YodJ protein n=1 Tax=Haloplasma contractile SSD-17B TaxID=1033810 RepID=U2E9L4_9MOLU|nr:M15 family metallopeptidase [Haloplasma contractile]ERJ11521.1 Putative carboxypeptidase YodJ protein [Haloplasma contractile SSD-17B]
MQISNEPVIKRLFIVFILIIISLSVYYYQNGATDSLNSYYKDPETQNLTYYQENSLEYIMDHHEEYKQLGYQNEDINEMIFILRFEELKDVLKRQLRSDILVPYLAYSNFKYAHMLHYEQVRKTNGVSRLEAINRYHHPNMTDDFYNAIQDAINPQTELVLVNKNYSLTKDYLPGKLVSINDLPLVIPSKDKDRNKVLDVTYQALKEMFKDSKKEGLNLFVSSGYRSFNRQDVVYNYYLVEGGRSYADSFSARPGHSEHQTGYAVDVTCGNVLYRLVEKFEDTQEGKWIKKHAHLYGFIIRYPKNREASTGYNYEPWHLRYVGTDAAKKIVDENLLLEEYLLKYTELPN